MAADFSTTIEYAVFGWILFPGPLQPIQVLAGIVRLHLNLAL